MDRAELAPSGSVGEKEYGEQIYSAPIYDAPIYSAPTLIRYGDVREITQALNTFMGNPDGMMIGPLVLKTGGF